MAGVTDLPFRRLCRQFGEKPFSADKLASARSRVDAPAGLYLVEMITARALVEGNRESWRMVEPDPHERVRSVQLYGTDPTVMAAATKMLVERGLADHIDMNFGCPVPKVTRRGGGAALPWKLDLYQDILTSVVRAADQFAPAGPGSVPVTVKMRVGIDSDHITALDAAKIAEKTGIAAVSLHARTQEQYYSGQAQWEWISRVKDSVSIPVFGNGDVFSVADATEMMEQTGCDAVVIGRGCQGRPWFFEELVAGMTGQEVPEPPNLGQVCEIISEHAELMVESSGGEDRAMREMRKHLGWYLRGFPVGGNIRRELSLVSSLDQLRKRLDNLPHAEPYPESAHGQRGRGGGLKRPHLPHNWLQSQKITPEQRQELHLGDGDGGSGG